MLLKRHIFFKFYRTHLIIGTMWWRINRAINVNCQETILGVFVNILLLLLSVQSIESLSISTALFLVLCFIHFRFRITKLRSWFTIFIKSILIRLCIERWLWFTDVASVTVTQPIFLYKIITEVVRLRLLTVAGM